MTLSQVRARFWIIKGKKTVKNVLRKCVICKKINGTTVLPPSTPDLPDYCVNVSMFSFQAVGVDYVGPLYVKNYLKTDSESKVYVLILTCASSRAAHLELIPGMKIAAFIRALKRFIAHRGIPDSITSDSFKTFKSIEVKTFCLNKKINKKFILPASPWWGGFYERFVKSVKIPLLKVMGKSLVTYEELQKVLCDIESVINSRQLVYMLMKKHLLLFT
ncbi:uncharacterized protein LOC136089882 [Hydra vulgaris]|uniref:Uncharacterized protein LOC136089881 n=1 Tax=Hydra vulgaris TaxID=6087 RepID=A0ABM4DCC8_HYDVU